MLLTIGVLAGKYFILVTPLVVLLSKSALVALSVPLLGSTISADVKSKMLKTELIRPLENVLQECFATNFSPRVVCLNLVFTE